MVGDWLQESMGQPTMVENKPGAGTTIAALTVARAAPDGYTLLVAADAHITMPLLTKLPYDPFKDFVPIGTVGINRYVWAVHPSVPVSNMKELIAYAKARPGKLNYGSSGNGAATHLGAEKFKLLTGTDIVHVPYKGAGPALTDALAGQYEISLWTPMAIAPLVSAGKLKPLAVTGPKRISSIPQIPTFVESGLPAYEHRSWLGVYAPAGTPKPIVDALASEITKMLASPRVREKFAEQGVEPFLSTPEEFTAMMRAETVELSKLIKAANVKID